MFLAPQTGVLHERNVLLTVETTASQFVAPDERLTIDTIGDDFYRAIVRFGFMERPDVPLALMHCGADDRTCFDPISPAAKASSPPQTRHADLRDKLFGVMHRNAAPVTGFFRIPSSRLVEPGAPAAI